MPRRSANEPALSSLDYLGLGNEENGLYTSCTYINMSVFMCIYIYLHIYAFIYTFIRLFIFYSFVSFFVFFDFGSFISLNVHTKRGNRNVARAPICIYTYLPIIYIYGFYVGQICIYIFYIHWLLYMYMWLLSLSLYICIYIYIGTYTPQSHHTSKSQPLAADLSNHPFK